MGFVAKIGVVSIIIIFNTHGLKWVSASVGWENAKKQPELLVCSVSIAPPFSGDTSGPKKSD